MPRFAEKLKTFIEVNVGIRKTPIEFRNHLKNNGCGVDDVAYELLSRASLVREREAITLVKYPLDQLLVNNTVHRGKLEKLAGYGLELCPFEAAFELRAQYLHQPEREALVVLTNEILFTPGSVRRKPSSEAASEEQEEGLGLGDWAVRRGVWGLPALVVRNGVPIITTTTYRCRSAFSPPQPMWRINPGNKNLKAVLIRHY